MATTDAGWRAPVTARVPQPLPVAQASRGKGAHGVARYQDSRARFGYLTFIGLVRTWVR